MPIPTWAVGQVLTASDVNTWFVPLAAVKPADTGRASNTTVTNDPDLQFTVAANASYLIEAVIEYKGGTNASSDAQFAINAPSGSGSLLIYRIQISGATFTQIVGSFNTAFGSATNGTGFPQTCFIKGTLTTTASGTVAVAWAQNTSNATPTTVFASSTLLAQRIG